MKSGAKYNNDVKIRPADFFLYVPQGGTYRITKGYIVSVGYIAPKAYRARSAERAE